MGKRKRSKKFNISNRLAYTLIIVLSIVLLGIGVYAYNLPPPTNVGHTTNEITWPTCSSGQVLGISGSNVVCVTPIDSRFTITSNGLCYNAPSTCTYSTQHCTNLLTLYNVPLHTNCNNMYHAERVSACLTACSEHTAYACTGVDSRCSGGGNIAYWRDAQAICEGLPELACTCSSYSDYTQATYVPAGQRCI